MFLVSFYEGLLILSDIYCLAVTSYNHRIIDFLPFLPSYLIMMGDGGASDVVVLTD